MEKKRGGASKDGGGRGNGRSPGPAAATDTAATRQGNKQLAAEIEQLRKRCADLEQELQAAKAAQEAAEEAAEPLKNMLEEEQKRSRELQLSIEGLKGQITSEKLRFEAELNRREMQRQRELDKSSQKLAEQFQANVEDSAEVDRRERALIEARNELHAASVKEHKRIAAQRSELEEDIATAEEHDMKRRQLLSEEAARLAEEYKAVSNAEEHVASCDVVRQELHDARVEAEVARSNGCTLRSESEKLATELAVARAAEESASLASASAKSEANLLRKQLTAAKVAEESAMSEANLLHQQLGAAKVAQQTAASTSESASSEVNLLRKQLAAAKETATSASESASAEVNLLRKQLAAAKVVEETVASASAEVNLLRNQLAAAEETATSASESASAEVKSLRAEASAAATEMAGLRELSSAAAVEVKSLRAEGEAAATERAGLRELSSAAVVEAESLRTEVASAERDAAGLREESSAAASEAQSLRAALATASDSKAAAEGEVARWKDETARAAEAAAAAKKEASELTEQCRFSNALRRVFASAHQPKPTSSAKAASPQKGSSADGLRADWGTDWRFVEDARISGLPVFSHAMSEFDEQLKVASSSSSSTAVPSAPAASPCNLPQSATRVLLALHGSWKRYRGAACVGRGAAEAELREAEENLSVKMWKAFTTFRKLRTTHNARTEEDSLVEHLFMNACICQMLRGGLRRMGSELKAAKESIQPHDRKKQEIKRHTEAADRLYRATHVLENFFISLRRLVKHCQQGVAAEERHMRLMFFAPLEACAPDDSETVPDAKDMFLELASLLRWGAGRAESSREAVRKRPRTA